MLPRASKRPRSTEKTDQSHSPEGSSPDDIAPLSARYTLDPEHLYDEALDNSESDIGDFLTVEDTYGQIHPVAPPQKPVQRPATTSSTLKPPKSHVTPPPSVQTTGRSTRPLLFIVVLIAVVLLPKLISDFMGYQPAEKPVGGFPQSERKTENRKTAETLSGNTQRPEIKQPTAAAPTMSIALSRVPVPKPRPTGRLSAAQFIPISKLGRIPGNTSTYVSGSSCANIAAAPYYITLLQVKDPGFKTFHVGYFKRGNRKIQCKLRFNSRDGRVAEGGSCTRVKGYRELFFEPKITRNYSDMKVEFVDAAKVNWRYTRRFRRCF